jgi:hypothetical protein
MDRDKESHQASEKEQEGGVEEQRYHLHYGVHLEPF